MLATERQQLLPATGLHSWSLPDYAVPLKFVVCKGADPLEAEQGFLTAFERYNYFLDTTGSA
jgi:hypothetical protein